MCISGKLQDLDLIILKTLENITKILRITPHLLCRSPSSNTVLDLADRFSCCCVMTKGTFKQKIKDISYPRPQINISAVPETTAENCWTNVFVLIPSLLH